MLFYLAHPVAADELHGVEDNLAHTLKMLRMVHEAGISVICPWFADIKAFDDTTYETRKTRMVVQKTLLLLCGGNIILTGHKLSSGMEEELDVVQLGRGRILDFIGVPDEELPEQLRIAFLRLAPHDY